MVCLHGRRLRVSCALLLQGVEVMAVGVAVAVVAEIRQARDGREVEVVGAGALDALLLRGVGEGVGVARPGVGRRGQRWVERSGERGGSGVVVLLLLLLLLRGAAHMATEVGGVGGEDRVRVMRRGVVVGREAVVVVADE